MQNETNFAEQLISGTRAAMLKDSKTLCFGLGVDDPKAIFGTTQGLVEEFGAERVFDMPTSENAMTGIGIGAAISGSRVLMTHQRVDFFMLAMDQLVNNAAKWHYMFNGQMKVPITIRLIIGRGWGQGPTHAQNLQAWFSHIPGLKVIVPSKTESVANQLYHAIMDDNPVVFLEHRWLHQQTCDQDQLVKLEVPFKKTQLHKEGEEITIVANSYMLLESLRAAKELAQAGINAEVLELASVNPIDWQPIATSVKKTGRLLVCDAGHMQGSVAGEVIAKITENYFSYLKTAPQRLALPQHPEPTSFGLTKTFYNDADDIVSSVMQQFGKDYKVTKVDSHPHDVPGSWFKGPF